MKYHPIIFEQDADGSFLSNDKDMKSNIPADHDKQLLYYLNRDYKNKKDKARKRAQKVWNANRNQSGKLAPTNKDLTSLDQETEQTFVAQAINNNTRRIWTPLRMNQRSRIHRASGDE